MDIQFFLKFGKKEHVAALLDSGQIFINHFTYFKQGSKDGRFDPAEGRASLLHLANPIVEIQDEHSQWKRLNTEKAKVETWWNIQNLHLFSLYQISAEQAKENRFYQLSPGTEKTSSIRLLHLLGVKADYKTYLDSLEKQAHSMSLYEQLRITELKQQVGITFNIDTLVKKQRRTVFGNLYWGEENHKFFDNSIQNTLAMYRILRAAGNNDEQLQKIRNYFLEKRRSGRWRNTYESSLILETILPDLLSEKQSSKPSTLTIKGRDTITVNKFPFSYEVRSGNNISISKQGNTTLYFTAYQQRWNIIPARQENNFTVRSFIEEKDKVVTSMKAGTPVALKVNVKVEADASYVLIEIPIPAGCSYVDKRQFWQHGEVHREYFKNKVSIFCKSLPRGDYEFSVSLLPRFSGNYTLNPAKAEMMYFPVFNGREGIKKVRIN